MTPLFAIIYRFKEGDWDYLMSEDGQSIRSFFDEDAANARLNYMRGLYGEVTYEVVKLTIMPTA